MAPEHGSHAPAQAEADRPRRSIDLVADVGESYGAYAIGDDEALIGALSSANVACGFHGGDPLTIERTVRACQLRGVAIGAHPGFRDLVGFGRRRLDMTVDEVRADVLYQIGALAGIARAAGAELAHVAPHGALGNLAVVDERYADGVAQAVADYEPTLAVMTQPGALERRARACGLPVAVLALPDRSYEDDGTLVSRREPDAVLHDPDAIVERALAMAIDRTVLSRGGARIEIACDTLLLHGDNAASIDAARRVRAALEREGVVVRPSARRAG